MESSLSTTQTLEAEGVICCREVVGLEKPSGKVFQRLQPPRKMQKKFWKEEQNLRYLAFLEENRMEFGKTLKEKTEGKLNVRMSQIVRSRNSLQCRSHHQKMIKKYGSIDGVITHLRQLLLQKDCPTLDDQPKLLVCEPFFNFGRLEFEPLSNEESWPPIERDFHVWELDCYLS